MKRTAFVWLACALVVGATVGCGNGDRAAARHTRSTTPQALIGRDSFLYFRCNATGWNLSDATRLEATTDPYVFALSYSVSQPWMITSGDDCTLTETSTRNAWGDWQQHYGIKGQWLEAPAGSPIRMHTAADAVQFKVKYGELGRYRVLVNWRDGILSVQKDEPEDPTSGQSFFSKGSELYLRCNATGWNLSDSTRLRASPAPRFIELRYEVKSADLVTSGDDCVLTETPEINRWGAWVKDYGAHALVIRVPDSARIKARRPDNATENMQFRVQYEAPGKYMARVDRQDGTLSIRKDALADPGQAVWTTPGYVTSDADQNLYLNTFFPERGLSRLDKTTGSPMWTRPLSSGGWFQTNCASNHSLFVKDGPKVVALDDSNGSVKWWTDIGGELNADAGYLTCYENADHVFVTYGDRSQFVAAVRKADGYYDWVARGADYVGVFYASPSHAVLSRYVNNSTRYSVLDIKTGEELWTIPGAVASPLFDDKGNIFVSEQGTIKRLEPASGQVRWTYETTGDYAWATFENNGVYVRESSRIVRLDKETGGIVWKSEYGLQASQYPYATILKSGHVVIRGSNANKTTFIALDPNHGEALWRKEVNEHSAWINEDKAGNIYLLQGSTLSLLNMHLGTPVWTFQYAAESIWDRLSSVVESDARSVYVICAKGGHQYPPMGIIALDIKSGESRWNNFQHTPVNLVTSDAERLYINVGVYSGTVKALSK